MKWPRPCALIANTDNHDKPGVHWVAVFLNQQGHAVYFDSYGLPPQVPQHLQRVRMNCKIYKWNTKRLQSFNSLVCGQYCLMFLYYMSHGYTMEKFCSMFSDNCTNNDKIARHFYNNYSRYKVKNRKINNNNYVLKGYGKK